MTAKEDRDALANNNIPVVYADGGLIDMDDEPPNPFKGLNAHDIDAWIRTGKRPKPVITEKPLEVRTHTGEIYKPVSPPVRTYEVMDGDTLVFDKPSAEWKLMMPETSKDTNPKDAVGIGKAPMSVVPAQVLMEVGLAMMEGARKYGAANYRVAGVRTSVYYDATMRHLMSWQEGQDTDPDSGLSHITKAIASLVVLRDAMMNDMVTDDRPPKAKGLDERLLKFNEQAKVLLTKYPTPVQAFTEV